MAHDTVWCEVCDKWVPRGHSEKKHAKTNFLSPQEESIQTFWHGLDK